MAPIQDSPIKVGHIDDVQELRKKKPTKIPERFVRDTIERPKLSTTLTSSDCIPIINYSELSNGNKAEGQVEILRLAKACEEWGFFQVKIINFTCRCFLVLNDQKHFCYKKTS